MFRVLRFSIAPALCFVVVFWGWGCLSSVYADPSGKVLFLLGDREIWM